MDVNNLRKIEAIHRRTGDQVFRMAISHLFDVGTRHLTEENVSETKQEIANTTKDDSFMTTDFQCKLLDIAFELSQFSIWDILLYIKLYVGIDGDDIANKEAAREVLQMWAIDRDEWAEAIKDEDVLNDLVNELVDQHVHNNYTYDEVTGAFHQIIGWSDDE